MAKFYIEVPHEEEKVACAKAIRILIASGSHFLTNAEFGCMDGDHNARIMVEVESKQEARSILPPAYRADAKIFEMNQFSLKEIDEFLDRHED